jgi:hypothetical protein
LVFTSKLTVPRYFIFAAALIVLSNEFFKLYAISMAQKLIQSSIAIMSYCAKTDPVAKRLLFILSSFRDVVDRQKGFVAKRQITNISEDPILNFLSTGTEEISSDHTRRSSMASVLAGSTGTIKRETADPIPIPMVLQVPSTTSASTYPPECPRRSSLDGNDSLGDGEIDFEAFWKPGAQPNPVSGGVQKWETVSQE